MRTTKRIVIELDPGETVEVVCSGAKLEIRANSDIKHDPNEFPEFEVIVPHGNMLGSIVRLNPDGSMGNDLGITELESSMQEVSGPISFVTYHANLT